MRPIVDRECGLCTAQVFTLTYWQEKLHGEWAWLLILSYLEFHSVCQKGLQICTWQLVSGAAASCFQTPNKRVLFPSLPQHKPLPISAGFRKLSLGEKWFQFQGLPFPPQAPRKASVLCRFAQLPPPDSFLSIYTNNVPSGSVGTAFHASVRA